MTPYRERRHGGFYNENGDPPQSTLSTNLGGLGAPQSLTKAGEDTITRVAKPQPAKLPPKAK